MADETIELTLKKVVKNSVVYATDDTDAAIPSVYIKKKFFGVGKHIDNPDNFPGCIQITVEKLS